MSEENESTQSAPKLFISYSWTDQDHMDWVLTLATDLRNNGVDAILDKFQLREGQDAHSFMEQMVRDPNVGKVILICDAKYVERADQRQGGVGAESQIISAQLYGDVQQTKFVPVCLASNDDGQALLPIFLNSRIYIDFRGAENYGKSFEQLIRWCFDKPLYIEPELGKPPAFLDETVAPIVRDASIFKRSISVSSQASKPEAAANFLRSARKSLADLTLNLNNDPNADDRVFEQIVGLAPSIERFVDIVETVISDHTSARLLSNEIHGLLEEMLGNYDKGSTQWSGDVTKFYGEFITVLFTAIYIRNEKFEEFDVFISTPFVKKYSGEYTGTAVSYDRLNTYLKSLEFRNNRLNARRASLHSDLVKNICELINFDFGDYMQADLVLHLRTLAFEDLRWWPDSLLYATHSNGAFPWFIKAISPQFRDRFLPTIGINSKAEFLNLVEKFKSDASLNPRWQSSFDRLDVPELANFEKILQSFK